MLDQLSSPCGDSGPFSHMLVPSFQYSRRRNDTGNGLLLTGDGEGVVFIPAHLAGQVVTASEKTRLRDTFAHERVQSGKYTAGQMDTEWTEIIQEDFKDWLKSNSQRLQEEYGVARDTIDDLLEDNEG